MKKTVLSLMALLLSGYIWADDITVNTPDDWQSLCGNADASTL